MDDFLSLVLQEEHLFLPPYVIWDLKKKRIKIKDLIGWKISCPKNTYLMSRHRKTFESFSLAVPS